MILRLLHAGSARVGPLGDAAQDYRQRLGRRLRTDEVFVRPVKLKREGAAEVQRALATEGERLLARVNAGDVLVALAIDGEAWSSERLSKRLQGWMNRGAHAVTFALGSAHGLDPSIAKRAEHRWSFGPLTLPHDLARVVLWEQLYRADTILRGEPYHK